MATPEKAKPKRLNNGRFFMRAYLNARERLDFDTREQAGIDETGFPLIRHRGLVFERGGSLFRLNANVPPKV